jgi:ubiquinone/menaquinone biosynthesis C-methylase UbiE
MGKAHSKSMTADAEYIMDLALGYQMSHALFAALHLNIFSILESGPKNASEIAKAAESDEESLRRLTSTLVAMNLLEKRHDVLFNSAGASTYLVKGKKSYLGNAVHHLSNLCDFWNGLDTQVKSGKAKEPDKEHLKNYRHRLHDYLAAMGDFAQLKAGAIADAISIENFSNMLDLGGGPGTYSLAFSDRNPDLHCTIVDLEPNLVYAKNTINQAEAQNRISISACNILEDKIPGSGYDLIFISNLIHIYNKEDVKNILEKAWSVTGFTGTIVIHDYLLDDSEHNMLHPSLFDLTMLVGTPAGRCYTSLEVKELLTALGAQNSRMVSVSLGSSLVIGEKQKI